MKRLFLSILVFVLALSVFLCACDMTTVSPDGPSGKVEDKEPADDPGKDDPDDDRGGEEEPDKPSGHTHVFDNRVIDSLYLASVANAFEPAKYYYVCECGTHGTETFEYGSPLSSKVRLEKNQAVNVEGAWESDIDGENCPFILNASLYADGGICIDATLEAKIDKIGNKLSVHYRAGELYLVYGGLGIHISVDDINTVKDTVVRVINEVRPYFNTDKVLVLDDFVIADFFGRFFDPLLYSVDDEGCLNLLFHETDEAIAYDKVKQIMTVDFAEGMLVGTVGDLNAAAVEERDYVTLTDLNALGKTVTEIFSVADWDGWSANLSATLTNMKPKYDPYDHVQYQFTGKVTVLRPTADKPMAVEIDIDAFAPKLDELCYYGHIIVVDRMAYVEFSFYNEDSTSKKRDPLFLKGDFDRIDDLLLTVERVFDIDLDFLLSPEDKAKKNVRSLTEFLEDLDSGMFREDLIYPSDIVNGFSIDGSDVTVVLDSAVIYGHEDLPDITAKIERDKDGNYIVLSGEKITFDTATDGYIDASIALREGGNAITAPENANAYLDISSIDQLVNLVLNSALDVEDGEIDVLDSYHFSGNISLKASLFVFDITYSPDVQIALDLKNEVVTLCVSYENDKWTNKGEYRTYITFNFGDEMVYMMRERLGGYGGFLDLEYETYSTPDRSYRSMTVHEFEKTLGSQVGYIFNFSGLICDLLEDNLNKSDDPGTGGDTPGTGGGGDTPTVKEQDDVGDYLIDFRYEENNHRFVFVVNGEQIFKGVRTAELYIPFDASGKITSVGFKIDIGIELNASLTFENTTSPDKYSLPYADLRDLWAVPGYELVMKSGITSSVSNPAFLYTKVPET